MFKYGWRPGTIKHGSQGKMNLQEKFIGINKSG